VRFLLAALLLAACAPPPPGIPDSSPCEDNTAPFIGNLTIDGTCAVGEGGPDCFSEAGVKALAADEPEEKLWSIAVSFQYADPGLDSASDLPNMVGGLVTGEATLYSLTGAWLYDPLEFSPGESPSYIALDDATASQGIITLEPGVPEDEIFYQSPLTLAVRVRDACDAVSNDLTCRYSMGTGEWINCEPPPAPADE
jgi:hypothetical protein